MNPALIELIILAGIAVFLFIRLRSVLGTREGFEKPRMQPKNDSPKRDFKVIDGGEDKDITDNVEKNSKSAKALKVIKEEERQQQQQQYYDEQVWEQLSLLKFLSDPPGGWRRCCWSLWYGL